ncbi:MAG: hypothetical protein WD271_05220 [Acidimicrobiia bacterium]
MAALGTGLDARPDSTAALAPEPTATIAAPTWFGRNWPVLALGAAAMVIAIVARHVIYPSFSWNRDELTYLWQTDALRGGHIFTTGGGAPQFYWPWLAGLRGDVFFPQYTVGWPLVLLVVDVIFGSPELALALGAALAVLGTYAFARALTDDRQLALVSGTLMLASPIVVIQGGVYLAYLFSLGLGLFFGAALLTGLRRESRWLLLGAGVILGWVLLTRPYDAVLWGGPLFAYAVFISWRKWGALWRAACWVAIGFVPFVAFTLLYNRRVTGSFTQFPITAKDPLDTFGFGPRRLMPIGQIFDYSIGRAARSVAHNLRTAPAFLVGGWLGAAAAVAGLWLRRRERSTLALLALAAAFPVGYFFFWGNLLSGRAASLSSPIYYVPLYAPACIFVATTVIAAWHRRRGLAVVLCAVVAVATIPYLVSKIGTNHKISAAQQAWKGATRSIQGRAAVIVEHSGPYLMHLNPYSQNVPDLDGKILYAVDSAAANLDLIAAHPDRTPYLERTSDPAFDDPVSYHDAPLPRVSLIPLRVLRGKTVTLRVRVSDPRDELAVVVFLQIGNHVEQRTLATDASAGATYETEWTLAPAASADLTTGTVPLTKRLGTIRIGMGAAATPGDALAQKQVQERFSYRLNADTDQVEVLYPSRKFVRHRRGRTLVREVDRLRELGVEITTNL